MIFLSYGIIDLYHFQNPMVKCVVLTGILQVIGRVIASGRSLAETAKWRERPSVEMESIMMEVRGGDTVDICLAVIEMK